MIVAPQSRRKATHHQLDPRSKVRKQAPLLWEGRVLDSFEAVKCEVRAFAKVTRFEIIQRRERRNRDGVILGVGNLKIS
jgi:hypothetical protein